MSASSDTFKVIVLGDGDVGKTCLIIRFYEGGFRTVYGDTKGINFWDATGPERSSTLRPGFYRGAHGIILVYDVTRQETFDHIPHWMEEASKWIDKDVSKVLIGNKCDLTEERVVDYQKAKEYADLLHMPVLEVSVLDGTNVEQALVTLVADMKRKAEQSLKPSTGYNLRHQLQSLWK